LLQRIYTTRVIYRSRIAANKENVSLLIALAT
jgi:hypothetical protein